MAATKPMTSEELYFWNLQNQGAVNSYRQINIPDGPGIPVDPPQKLPNAFRALNPKNPLAFPVPDMGIPNIERSTSGSELLKRLSGIPKQLRYSASDLAGLSGYTPPPLSGQVPTIGGYGANTAGLPAIQQPASAVSNASALVPQQQGNRQSVVFKQPNTPIEPPAIEGEVISREFGPRISASGTPEQRTGGGGGAPASSRASRWGSAEEAITAKEARTGAVNSGTPSTESGSSVPSSSKSALPPITDKNVIVDDYGNVIKGNKTTRPVGPYGDEFVGSGLGSRPAVGDPNNLSPSSPNGPAGSTKTTLPPRGTNTNTKWNNPEIYKGGSRIINPLTGVYVAADVIGSDTNKPTADAARRLTEMGITPSKETISLYLQAASPQQPDTMQQVDLKLAKRDRLGVNQKTDPLSKAAMQNDNDSRFWNDIYTSPIRGMEKGAEWYNKLFGNVSSDMTPEQVDARWRQMQLEGKLPKEIGDSNLGMTEQESQKTPVKSLDASIGGDDKNNTPATSETTTPPSAIAPSFDQRFTDRSTVTKADEKASDAAVKEVLPKMPLAFADAAVKRDGGRVVDVMPTGVNPNQRVAALPPETLPNGQPGRQVYNVYGNKGLQGTIDLPPDFMGGRRGGPGTLSYVNTTRTPEEQKAIDATVASINKQTAAMRGMRNANRKEQGMPTVEEEDQMDSMRAMMNKLAPAPNLSGMDEQQASFLKQLEDASNIRGIGQGRFRDDKIKAAQIGLGLVGQQREAALRDHQQRQAFLQNVMQTQGSQAAAQAKLALERADKAQDQDNADRTYNADRQDAELAAAQAGEEWKLKAARLGLDAKWMQKTKTPPMNSKYYGVDETGQPAFYSKLFDDDLGIKPYSKDGKGMEKGKIYSVGDGSYVMIDPKTGIPTDGLSRMDVWRIHHYYNDYSGNDN